MKRPFTPKSPRTVGQRRRHLADQQEASEKPADKVDEALEESFPASDPPSWSAPARIGPPLRKPGHS